MAAAPRAPNPTRAAIPSGAGVGAAKAATSAVPQPAWLHLEVAVVEEEVVVVAAVAVEISRKVVMAESVENCIFMDFCCGRLKSSGLFCEIGIDRNVGARLNCLRTQRLDY